MDSHETECVPIHHNQVYIEPAVELLEKQWPHEVAIREKRIQSMKELSRDDLPCHLVLLRKETKKLLGHSLLKRADGRSDGRSAVVFSVVIDHDLRGKGYGRILMRETEFYARDHGFTHLFLSTDDQVGFYKRLGYQECEPITSLGSNSKRLTSEQVEALENLFAKRLGNSHVNVSNQTWLKKRLIEEYPIEDPYPAALLPKLILKEISGGQEEYGDGQLTCAFGVFISIPWQQQAGPNCGIATVNMLKESLNTSTVPKQPSSTKPCDCTGDLSNDSLDQKQSTPSDNSSATSKSSLQTASHLGISRDGEMFCSYNLSYLASVSHGLPLVVNDVGPDTLRHIALNITSGYPCLIPYDRSIGNHKPMLAEGTRAHWAVICGIIVAPCSGKLPDVMNWSFEYKDPETESFCGLMNFGDFAHSENLKSKIVDNVTGDSNQVYILCVHGMSRTPFVSTLSDMLASNANLHRAKSRHFAAAKDLAHLRNKIVTLM